MKPLRILAVFALGGVVCTAAIAQSSAEKIIRAYYAKDDALMLKMDFAGWRKLTIETSTSDYVSYGMPDKTGKVTKKTLADQISGLDRLAPIIESVPTSTNHIDHITIGPKTILVTVTARDEMKTKKLPQDGKSHTIGGTMKPVGYRRNQPSALTQLWPHGTP